jgi:xanthine dehydrogenase molybdopterin-binding subunit B
MSITRCDILEDTGMAISPEVDIGQVEGGLIMGLGLWTSEKVRKHMPLLVPILSTVEV